MKIGLMRVLGVWVLLAAMVFALVKLDTAEQWVAWWIPFVIAGVSLVLVGTVTAKVAGGSNAKKGRAVK
jgi:VIT1/CCC1 family predicted Fe2+/Mn2+ transporter